MKLTREWQEYDHDYTKDVHDIRTADGKEYLNCWPNAGMFNVMAKNKEDCIQIPDAEVTHVRCSKSWMTEDEQEEKETDGKGYPVHIGHVDHGRTALTAAIGDTYGYGNWSTERASKSIVISNKFPIEPSIPIIKRHKPNTGFNIGSYKFRSKK